MHHWLDQWKVVCRPLMPSIVGKSFEVQHYICRSFENVERPALQSGPAGLNNWFLIKNKTCNVFMKTGSTNSDWISLNIETTEQELFINKVLQHDFHLDNQISQITFSKPLLQHCVFTLGVFHHLPALRCYTAPAKSAPTLTSATEVLVGTWEIMEIYNNFWSSWDFRWPKVSQLEGCGCEYVRKLRI